jgi:hypothetical protein
MTEDKNKYITDILGCAATAALLWGIIAFVSYFLLQHFGLNIMQAVIMSSGLNVIRNITIIIIGFSLISSFMYNLIFSTVHFFLLSKWSSPSRVFNPFNAAFAAALKLLLLQVSVGAGFYLFFKGFVLTQINNRFMGIYGIPAQASAPWAQMSPYFAFAMLCLLAGIAIAIVCGLFIFLSRKYGFFKKGINGPKMFAALLAGVVISSVIILAAALLLLTLERTGILARFNPYVAGFFAPALFSFVSISCYGAVLLIAYKIGVNNPKSEDFLSVFPGGLDIPKVKGKVLVAADVADALIHSEPEIPSLYNTSIATALPRVPAKHNPEHTITSLDLAPVHEKRPEAPPHDPAVPAKTMPVISAASAGNRDK